MTDRMKLLLAKEAIVNKINDERIKSCASAASQKFVNMGDNIKIVTTPAFKAEVTQCYLEDSEFRAFIKNLAKVEVDDQ